MTLSKRTWIILGAGLLLICLVTTAYFVLPMMFGTQLKIGKNVTASSRRLNLSFTVTYEDESWFGKAELYLLVHTTQHPKLKLLFPLNVGEYSGRRTGIVATPFYFNNEKKGSLRIELLDDDSLSKAQQQAIVDAAKNGAYILWYGTKMYALGQGSVHPDELGDMAVELSGITAEAIVENIETHQFDSYGYVECPISENGVDDVRDAMPVSICEPGKMERVQLKLFFSDN